VGEKQIIKLLQRAKDAPGGFSRAELIELYEGFGFHIEAGAKHDLAKHPNLPDGIKGTITRSSKPLHPDYIRTAVDLIELSQKKKGE
jgi:hypothetical protein